MAADPVAGRVRASGLAQAGPGDLGGSRQAAALRLIEADVLGGDGPGGKARGDPRREQTRGRLAGDRDEIKADILEHGVDKRGVLVQHYDTESLDASTLLAAIFGFLPGEDERMRASVLAIADELTEHGFVLRYRTDETDDGLSGKEGTFVICSFWLVSALAIIGEMQRARDLMERSKVASPLLLYAEEFDVDTGRHLGNFPQAFSHLALVEAAGRIILAERIEELGAMSDYDVIVIGSGAGGGTLVPAPGAFGQADPAARARRLAAPRAPELARPRTCSSKAATSRRTPGTTRTLTPFAPQVHYYVGGATKLYGAALYRLRERDFGELHHHDGISPAWPISYDEMEPYYTQAEQLYQVHGARGEDPTEPPSSGPYPFPAVSHEPRIQQLSDDLAKVGLHPFHAPCGILLDEANLPYSKCVRCNNCDGFPCLVHAKSDAEVIAVRPALEHPNVTLLTGAEAVRLETNDAGTAVTGVVGTATARPETITGRHRGRLLRRRQQRQAAARVGQRRPPKWTGQRIRPGRAQLHVPQQPGRARALKGREPDGVPEDARGQRLLLLGGEDFEYPLGTSRWSASPRRRCSTARNPARPGSRPTGRSRRWRRHAVDFWLSTEDLPPRREPGHARPRRQHPIDYKASNEEAKDRLYHKLKDMLGDLGMHHGHLLPHHAYLKNEIPVAGCAHQAGTCRFGADPRPGCSTPTAGPTSSTTCTSSTRASSRASARSTRR